MPADELAEAIAGRRRACLHRLVGQVALYVARQAVGCLVTPAAVLLQALHDDPVELAPHQLRQLARLQLAAVPRRPAATRCCSAGARPRRLFLRDHAGTARARPPPATAAPRVGSSRSAARRGSRPGRKRRCACRRRGCSNSACSGLMYSGVPMHHAVRRCAACGR